MLEHIPAWLGTALRSVRAGHDRLAVVEAGPGSGGASIALASPAFADGGRLPARFTADGAGVSPPLVWRGLPEETGALALIVEDADAPMPRPLVHAVIWGMPADVDGLPEGAIAADGAGDAEGDVGRNSYLREGWLPPDPPTGHGAHAYVFQLFALSDAPPLPADPGRGAVIAAMAGRVLAVGVLTGTYSRDEAAPVGPVGATQPA